MVNINNPITKGLSSFLPPPYLLKQNLLIYVRAILKLKPIQTAANSS